MNDQAIIIVCISAFLLLLYLPTALRSKHSSPDLTEALTLILCSVGFVSGGNLAFIAIFTSDQSVGQLSSERIPILIGAVAILWISVEAVFKIYTRHWTTTQDEDGETQQDD